MPLLDSYVVAACMVVAALFSGLITYVLTGRGWAAVGQTVIMLGALTLVLAVAVYVKRH